MQLSDLQKATLNLSINDCNRKDEGNKNDSMKAPAKRLYFSPPTFPQNWSLPDSIIYYITMTPSSSKGYQKLIQSCKYFFSKNPIIVCSDFTFEEGFNKSETCVPKIEIKQDGLHAYIGLENLYQKFWITYECNIFVDDVVKKGNILSKVIIPHIYRFEARNIELGNHNISYNEYLLLAANVERLRLKDVTVKNEDGSVVSVEKLIEVSVNAEKIFICIDEDADLVISSKTVKNLLQIPRFASLTRFCLWGIPEAFDIDTFFAYIKENKNTVIFLQFSSKISDQYKEKIDDIVDEIHSTETHEYKPPAITYW